MEHLLFLVHRIPYPPNKGDKIRSFHLLKHLAQRYHVHLGAFVDDAADWQYVNTVKAFCQSSHFARLDPRMARLRSLCALSAGRALSLDYYQNRGLHEWVAQTLRTRPVSRVLVFSSVMAQYAQDAQLTRRVVDFVDVDSDKWMQYCAKKSGPMRWLYRRESRQLLKYEQQVAAHADAALFVSRAEAQLFRRLAPASAHKTGYFNNGVDLDYFSPAHHFDNPYPAASQVIVFTGAMDYWPNIDAVQWFASAVMPLLRQRLPQVLFYIVGSRPSAQVRALADLPGVEVSGTVPDIRPYLAHAGLAVAPLRIARGIQNKVLEAMAMRMAVLVSPQALEGIDAVAGQDLALAEQPQAFADSAAALLENRDGQTSLMAARARTKMESAYAWHEQLAALDALLENQQPVNFSES